MVVSIASSAATSPQACLLRSARLQGCRGVLLGGARNAIAAHHERHLHGAAAVVSHLS